MKKFYTIISLQQDLDDERSAYCYQAVGNPKLQLDHKTRFPIMTAMEGYTQPGEEIAVIAVVTDLGTGTWSCSAARWRSCAGARGLSAPECRWSRCRRMTGWPPTRPRSRSC